MCFWSFESDTILVKPSHNTIVGSIIYKLSRMVSIDNIEAEAVVDVENVYTSSRHTIPSEGFDIA